MVEGGRRRGRGRGRGRGCGRGRDGHGVLAFSGSHDVDVCERQLGMAGLCAMRRDDVLWGRCNGVMCDKSGSV